MKHAISSRFELIESTRASPCVTFAKMNLNVLMKRFKGGAVTRVSPRSFSIIFPRLVDTTWLFLEQRTCTFISIGNRLRGKKKEKKGKKNTEKGEKRKKERRERGQKTREIASQGISFEHKRNRNRRCRDINR